jgi:hypothetical protein
MKFDNVHMETFTTYLIKVPLSAQLHTKRLMNYLNKLYGVRKSCAALYARVCCRPTWKLRRQENACNFPI